MKDYRIAWTVCPWCRELMDGAYGATGNRAPIDGDGAICGDCGNLSVFDSSLLDGKRRPTDDEMVEFAADPRIVAAVLTVRHLIASRN